MARQAARLALDAPDRQPAAAAYRLDPATSTLEPWQAGDTEGPVGWAARLPLGRPVAFDTETDGLGDGSGRGARLRVVSFGTLDHAWIIPAETPEGRRLVGRVMAALRPRRLAAHNANFDLRVLASAGIAAGCPEPICTQELWKTLDPTRRMAEDADRGSGGTNETAVPTLPADLGSLLDAYAPTPEYGALFPDLETAKRTTAGKAALAEAFAAADLYDTRYLTYAGWDAVGVARLIEASAARIREIEALWSPAPTRYGTVRDLLDIEMAALAAVRQAEDAGVLLDVATAATMAADLAAEAERIETELDRFYRLANPRSTAQTADLLARLGFDPPLTRKGNPSVKTDWLETLDHPFAAALARYRKAHGGLRTAINGLIEAADAHGIVRGRFWLSGTKTGRMSASAPNLQNVPKHPAIRGLLTARPGNELVVFDYSGVEFRLAADIFDDPTMLEDVLSGDPHTNTAADLGIDRQTAKAFNFASIYGAGPDTLAAHTGMLYSEARKVHKAWHNRYPGIRRGFARIEACRREQAATDDDLFDCVSAFGRPLTAGATYRMANYQIQGAAADLFKQALARVYRAGLAKHLRLLVHDEAVFEIPEGDDGLAAELRGLMEEPDLLRVPLEVGCERGPTWGGRPAAEAGSILDLLPAAEPLTADSRGAALARGRRPPKAPKEPSDQGSLL